MSITCGPQLIVALQLAKKANQPVLLEGGTGIGKSQMVREAAAMNGWKCIVLDLSLMEPTDLVGMPKIENGRTIYAPPAFLPNDGEGIFLLEELNRAAPEMLAPTLELLTSRRLNDYTLPPGWLPMAAINPCTEDYTGTRPLDAAILARFMRLHVRPSVREWVAWAKQPQRGIHVDVIEFIQSMPHVFDARESNPRAWAAVSRILSSATEDGEQKLLMDCISGLVGEQMASSFLKWRKGGKLVGVDSDQVLADYLSVQQAVKMLVKSDDTAAISALLHQVLTRLQDPECRVSPEQDQLWRKNLNLLANDLKGDFRRMLKEHLNEQ